MASEIPAPPIPELAAALASFLTAVDGGAADIVFAHYHPEFCCVRTAGDGAAVRLDRDSMIGFWRSPRSHAGDWAARGDLTARSTEIILVKNDVSWGVALLFRDKNFGAGWEKVFYTFVWKRVDDRWLLWREFVQQQTVPEWARGGVA